MDTHGWRGGRHTRHSVRPLTRSALKSPAQCALFSPAQLGQTPETEFSSIETYGLLIVIIVLLRLGSFLRLADVRILPAITNIIHVPAPLEHERNTSCLSSYPLSPHSAYSGRRRLRATWILDDCCSGLCSATSLGALRGVRASCELIWTA